MNVSRRKELFPEVTDAQWDDWKWQVKNRIETLDQLKNTLNLLRRRKRVSKDTLYPQDGDHSLLYLTHQP